MRDEKEERKKQARSNKQTSIYMYNVDGMMHHTDSEALLCSFSGSVYIVTNTVFM